MNNQIAFSKMVRHLRKQNAQSIVYFNGQVNLSAYYSCDGNKCPVGAIIPENLYSEDMEFMNVEEMLPHHKQLQELLSDVEIDLLVSMQEIHDDKPLELWESEFRRVAYNFNLAIPLGD